MPEVTAHSGLLSKTKVHVEDTGGNGRPVVLIHGWPLSLESWDDQVQPLADAGYRVVRYDRRGFGRSDKPHRGFDYDTLSDDLDGVLKELDLTDVTLVGFSMGGGEVARYASRHGEQRLHSVVFAGSVTPYMAKNEDNPHGPLDKATADEFQQGLTSDRDAFFEQFTTMFFSAGNKLMVSEEQRKQAVAMCQQADQRAVMGCMEAFGTTDFRLDLPKVDSPALVIHGSQDGIVPFEGSGALTHDSLPQSQLVLVEGAPHGFNVSHKDQFNAALLDFLAK